jgi:photosystem II stability/assembly factor-like uncharacterized protein
MKSLKFRLVVLLIGVGTSLGGQTRISQEYISGNLSCSGNCLTSDTTNRAPRPNEPPVLKSIGDKSVNRNATLTFAVSGTDTDENTLTYSARNLPSGASFKTTTRIFSWTPSQIGTSQVTFTVSDGELQDSETINVISRPTFDGWRVLPIRSEEEFNLGMIGGEAEQHMHGTARSLSDPNIIYMSHDVAQVWKSTNAGASWKKTLGINLSLVPGQSIEVDPVNPDIVFLIVDKAWNWLIDQSYEGLYRSKDGGDTWEQVLSAEETVNNMYRHNIAYDLSNITSSGASRWYAAFPGRYLYRSDDYGDNWNVASDLSGHSFVYQIQVHPSDGRVCVASTEGLFVSDSQGSNLQALGDLPAGAVSSVQINPQNPDIIYAVLHLQGLYKSTDGGNTFSLLRSFDSWWVFMNPGYPDTIYLVGTSSNIITSHDGGTTWITDMQTAYRAPRFDLETNPWRKKIAGALTGIVPNPNDKNEAVAFSRGTFWKTTDGGHTFVDSSTLFTGYAWHFWNDCIDFDRNEPDRFVTFNGDVGPIFTNNNGDYFERRDTNIWSWYNSGLTVWKGSYSGGFHPSDPNIIVASVGRGFRTQLMRTADGGQNWTLITRGSKNEQQHFFIAFHTNDPNVVYAGDKISHDTGRTFSHVDFGRFNTYDPYIIGMCLSNPDTIYALDLECYRILRSDDRGASWYLYSQPGWKFRRSDSKPTFAVDPVDCNKVYTLRDYDLAVFDGKTWRNTRVLALAGGSELKNFVRSVAIDPRNNSIIYAGMSAAGISDVWRSQDNGHSWKDISYNLPRTGRGAMAVNPHTGELLVGTHYGTWIFPSPDMKNNPLYDKAVSMPSRYDGLQNGDEKSREN